MNTYKIFSANVNGTFTQIKAKNKKNARTYYISKDNSVKLKDITVLDTVNSHQVPVEDAHPHLF